MAKRGLGRGLDALLGGAQSAPRSNKEAGVAGDGLPKMLAVDLVQRGRFQPRRHFDEDKLRELADSIAAQGVVQPVVVRPVGEGKHELIAGERRWRAAQLAGLTEIPVVVRDVDDQAAMAMGLIENIQRDDLIFRKNSLFTDCKVRQNIKCLTMNYNNIITVYDLFICYVYNKFIKSNMCTKKMSHVC
ncbi:MAG TPA: ParB/RepB/Spo0J family partition protein [Chromatiaceae bacterium]|nr:ParB/RepB/Spo0J family partition protein [Chromatiaceae bacterium]